MNPFEPTTGSVPPPPRPKQLQVPPYTGPDLGLTLPRAPRPVPAPPTTRQIANRNFILGALIGGLLVAAVAGWFVALSDAAEARLPACVTEDSSGCYWDADTMGNHTGQDVVVLP